MTEEEKEQNLRESYYLFITTFNEFVSHLYDKKITSDFEFVEPTEKNKVDILDDAIRRGIYETILIGTRTLRDYENFIDDFESGLFNANYKSEDLIHVKKEEPEIMIFDLNEYSDIKA